jgi:hypothetical protein
MKRGATGSWSWALAAAAFLFGLRRRRAGSLALVLLLGATSGCGQPASGPTLANRSSVTLAPGTEPVWIEWSQLSTSDGIALSGVVALSGDAAVLRGGRAGGAYAFSRVGARWEAAQRLDPNDAVASSCFGCAVAVSGDVALVGDYLGPSGAAGAGGGGTGGRGGGVGGSSGGADAPGAAYSFNRTGLSFGVSQKLTASDGAGTDGFGISVAVDGEVALIGTSSKSSAYVFARSGSMWTERQKLTASDGTSVDEFGRSVALSRDTALVAAAAAASDRGAVYSFSRTGATWGAEQKIVASDGLASARFGRAIALSDDTILVAASDAAYAFTRTGTGTTWGGEQKLVSPAGAAIDAVAVSGDFALTGAGTEDLRRGAVYTWTRSRGTWSLGERLVVNGGIEGQGFGTALAMSGPTALIGGAIPFNLAYVYVLVGSPCASNAECITGSCADGVCCDTPCPGSCEACGRSLGASFDGRCEVLRAGSPGSPGCGNLTCTGRSSECSPCTADPDCASDRYCAEGGTCEPRKEQGEACHVAAGEDCLNADCRACGSGLACADEVCCDSPCEGCAACLESLTGRPDGTCAPIPEGTDPREVCEAHGDYPASCLSDGACDGNGECRDFAPAGTPCGDTACDGQTVVGFLCTGEGQCESGNTSCSPYACRNGRCRMQCASDADCADDGFCNAVECTTKEAIGNDCTEDRECQDGQCVDGFCCNSSCSGQCDACGEDGTAGTCTPILGEPRGDRPSCAAGFRCQGGACTADGHYCAEDGITRVTPEGESVDCAPYRCDEGACILGCDSAADCVPGYRCTSNGECVATGDTGPTDGGGCGCRALSLSDSRNAWPVALFAALGLALRRSIRRGLRRGPDAGRASRAGLRTGRDSLGLRRLRRLGLVASVRIWGGPAACRSERSHGWPTARTL